MQITFLRTGPKRAGQGREAVRKAPESKTAEEGVDPMVSPKKRKGESHGATGNGGKKHKADSIKASDAEAEKDAKDAESVASEESKATTV
jgi:hypothetical protein